MKSPPTNIESLPSPPAKAKTSWLRKSTKVGLSLLGIVLLIPIIGLIWLNIHGVTVTEVKGLRYDNGIQAKQISLRLFNYHVTFHQLSLQHQIDPKNLLDSRSYRLFAKKYEIELPSITTAMLEKQNIYLRYIHFFDATFRFVDFTSPLTINARARKVTASAAHSDGKESAATQIIEQVDVTITNTPHLVISGHSNKGKLNFFFPQDQPSPHYPIRFIDSQFSIAWQDNQTPVSVTIASLHPQWETLNNTLPEQVITKLSLTFDLNRSLPTMKLMANTVKLEQPKYLPEFVNRTDIDSKGIHLGQAIANLARLPIKKLKVNALTYGDLLIDAKVILKTPLNTITAQSEDLNHNPTPHHKTATEKARKKIEQQAKTLNIATDNKTKAHFIVKGKALAPNPYQLDVNIYHLSKTNARAHTIMTRSDGNNLNCDVKIIFHQPLPQYLNCNANFKNTKEFTDRLGLDDMPDAQIKGPLRFYAKQVVNNLSKTTNPMVINNKIVDAHYRIGIELPPSFTIELNKYTVEAPFFHSKDKNTHQYHDLKHIAKIQMNSDGKINFNISYKNTLFQVALGDKDETISFKNANTNSEFSFFIDELNCLYPNIQCHINANINAKINTVQPTNDSKIDNVLFSSKVKAIWANNYLIAQLQQTHFQAKKLLFQRIPTLENNKINNIDFSLNQLICVFEKKKDRLSVMVYQPKNTQAQLSAQLSTRHQAKKTTLMADYSAELNIAVSKLLLRHEILFNNTSLQSPATPLTLSSNINIAIDNVQRNYKQLFPSANLYGHFYLAANKLQAEATLANLHNDVFVKLNVNTDLMTKETRVKLHRNTITFTNTRHLKKYYFPTLPLPFDITDGSITMSAVFMIDSNNQLTGTTTISTDHLSGNYHGIDVSQLDSNIHLAFSPDGIQTLSPIALFAQQLKAGITFTKPSLIIDANTQTNQYTLHRIATYVLGGSLSAHSINLTDLPKSAFIPMTIFGIKIDKIIDQIDHDGIEFTGILDGTIPIAIIDGKIEIHDGVLHSRYPGGILRYIAGSMIDENIKAAGHQSPLMVSEILKNYHYRTLAMKVNYAKDGVLKTQSYFKGYNPDFQHGRPININVTIEDNVLELIKTINILNASNVEQKISEYFNHQ
ncbi:hypothetical protein GRJ22_03795 [Photobacterium carnosum]|uniref:intermembrane phospholipid transport protein YdbH family protein n=1 Tax=Photobacterium carnosum TaxID=2023717 RepID=UPI001E325BD1|nr:hypothetical protein [Photobacterium carnosum]